MHLLCLIAPMQPKNEMTNTITPAAIMIFAGANGPPFPNTLL